MDNKTKRLGLCKLYKYFKPKLITEKNYCIKHGYYGICTHKDADWKNGANEPGTWGINNCNIQPIIFEMKKGQ